MSAHPSPNGAGSFTVEGEAVLFGFPTQRAVMTIRKRPFGWRAGGAARTMAIFVPIAVVVMIVPPHAPWALGALATGAILARRRWLERFTLEDVRATCPKCGAKLEVKPGRLKTPHPVNCEACQHQTSLVVPEQALTREA